MLALNATHQRYLTSKVAQWLLVVTAGLILALSIWTPAAAQLCQNDRVTLSLKTLGGCIDWTDQLIWSDWRIQQHARDGHCRLLDAKDRRRAIGSFEFCVKQLFALYPTENCDQYQKRHVVIVLHGLAGSRLYMKRMEKHLEECGFEVISFGYASTKLTIQELASSLESVVHNLVGADQVSFVAHSMGNIVVRNFLYRVQNCPNPPQVEFGRMVMISPPNQGAFLANNLGQRKIIQAIFGPAVDQFAHVGGWPALEQELATPWFEFGIVAGGRGTEYGYLMRVPGDDDGLLSIESHYLAGAADFIQVGGIHQLMPLYKDTLNACSHFLEHGHFPR